MILKIKPICLLLAVLLLTISSFSSSDKDDKDFTKPEDLVNTTWDCNEPPVEFEDLWEESGLKKLQFIFKSTTKAKYWTLGEDWSRDEGTMTYEISGKNITLIPIPDDTDFDDLKWTGSINGNKMSLTFKGAHLPGGRIGPFIFVKQ